MNQKTVSEDGVKGNHDDFVYDSFLEKINQRFSYTISDRKEPIFTTSTSGLFDIYLNSFSDDQRQYHNCHACRKFIERFGGLATITDSGEIKSAIWNPDDAPEFYIDAVRSMQKSVVKSKITGVFLSSDSVWGDPVTGIWKHFYIKPGTDIAYKGLSKTAGQAMAEKKEDFKTVIAALNEFKLPAIEQAIVLLKSDALYRSEKVLGPIQWLHDLHVARNGIKGQRSTNIVWKAVAIAPAGFCHPRASMAGTLLEDIADGMSFETVSRRFAEKMHPLQYQRPSAAPSLGNIEQAEKIVEKLGISKSLERRFARLDEVVSIWRPAEQIKEEPKGVFGHLKNKPVEPMRVPAQAITWIKFETTVLPESKSIDVFVPSRGDFIALLTAVHEDAPPILQWDMQDARNPVSWYRYHNGSPSSRWGLPSNSWCSVTAICYRPSMWFGVPHNQAHEAMFILSGAKDSDCEDIALFPEILKAELHSVRKTIEAYSHSAKPSGVEEASACGICAVGSHVRVNGIEYKIDRWD